MKTHRPYPMAFITPKGERACRAGHPWVYDAEVERIVEAGDPKEAARTWKESIESGGITPENGASSTCSHAKAHTLAQVFSRSKARFAFACFQPMRTTRSIRRFGNARFVGLGTIVAP